MCFSYKLASLNGTKKRTATFENAIHKLSTKCINFSLIVIMCVLMGLKNSREEVSGDSRLKCSRNVHFMWLWEMRFFFIILYAKWSNYEDGIKRQIEHASCSLWNVHILSEWSTRNYKEFWRSSRNRNHCTFF